MASGAEYWVRGGACHQLLGLDPRALPTDDRQRPDHMQCGSEHLDCDHQASVSLHRCIVSISTGCAASNCLRIAAGAAGSTLIARRDTQFLHAAALLQL